MRLRRRHAWGAVLIGLFALPLLKPEGLPEVERPAGSVLGWFARTPLLNPRLWREGGGEDVADGPSVAALERDRAMWIERLAQALDRKAAVDSLREALDPADLERLPLVRPARVLRSSDASGYRRSLLIDRGAEDGILEGAAVVEGDVLLGRVRMVYPRSSLVQLVTDSRTRLEVAVRTDRDVRLRGFLRGTTRGGDEDLEVHFTRVRDETGRIPLGAPVFTSNADERVPAGLLVGVVTKVLDPDVDGMPVLEVRPSLELDRALDVFVVLPR